MPTFTNTFFRLALGKYYFKRVLEFCQYRQLDTKVNIWSDIIIMRDPMVTDQSKGAVKLVKCKTPGARFLSDTDVRIWHHQHILMRYHTITHWAKQRGGYQL